jgi:hypothetical protein
VLSGSSAASYRGWRQRSLDALPNAAPHTGNSNIFSLNSDLAHEKEPLNV